jgi:hypothetical protein
VIRRIVAPPAFPVPVWPGTPVGIEHVATQNPRADIARAARGKIVIYTGGAGTSPVHLLKSVGGKEPFMQLHAAFADGIFQTLVWAGSEAVDGNRETRYAQFAHIHFSFEISPLYVLLPTPKFSVDCGFVAIADTTNSLTRFNVLGKII